MVEDGDSDGAKRTIGMGMYWVRTVEEQDEAKFLSRMDGNQHFSKLIFKAVDAELDRLRQQFAPQLAAWREGQQKIAEAGKK